jgi:hypothetical protein
LRQGPWIEGRQEKLVGYRLAVAAAVCASVALPVACSSIENDHLPAESLDASSTDAAGADATTDTTLPDASLDTAADGTSADLDAEAGALSDASDAGSCDLDLAGEPTELRCTGLYSDFASLTIAPDVHVYDPGLHLWSDGAVKTRWVYLPPGTKIDTTNMDEWVFPVGTKFWKQFVVKGVVTETRLLHKTGPNTWYPTTYYWEPGGTTTTELTTGALNVNDSGYEIPSQFECKACHQGRTDFVLGFEAVSLSSPGASGLPISTLQSQGLLTAPPSTPITVPGTATESAALGYLHANCGIACHNPDNGAARSTGFFMRLNVSELASVSQTDTVKTGWNMPTVAFLRVPDRIAQCDPSSSCVYFRMSHRDGVADAASGTQMPPIDTHQVDPTGEAVIAAWINEGCDAGADGGL